MAEERKQSYGVSNYEQTVQPIDDSISSLTVTQLFTDVFLPILPPLPRKIINSMTAGLLSGSALIYKSYTDQGRGAIYTAFVILNGFIIGKINQDDAALALNEIAKTAQSIITLKKRKGPIPKWANIIVRVLPSATLWSANVAIFLAANTISMQFINALTIINTLVSALNGRNLSWVQLLTIIENSKGAFSTERFTYIIKDILKNLSDMKNSAISTISLPASLTSYYYDEMKILFLEKIGIDKRTEIEAQALLELAVEERRQEQMIEEIKKIEEKAEEEKLNQLTYSERLLVSTTNAIFGTVSKVAETISSSDSFFTRKIHGEKSNPIKIAEGHVGLAYDQLTDVTDQIKESLGNIVFAFYFVIIIFLLSMCGRKFRKNRKVRDPNRIKELENSPKRKSPKRKSPKRKSPKRKSPKRKSPKRKSPKRKSPKRK